MPFSIHFGLIQSIFSYQISLKQFDWFKNISIFFFFFFFRKTSFILSPGMSSFFLAQEVGQVIRAASDCCVHRVGSFRLLPGIPLVSQHRLLAHYAQTGQMLKTRQKLDQKFWDIGSFNLCFQQFYEPGI